MAARTTEIVTPRSPSSPSRHAGLSRLTPFFVGRRAGIHLWLSRPRDDRAVWGEPPAHCAQRMQRMDPETTARVLLAAAQVERKANPTLAGSTRCSRCSRWATWCWCRPWSCPTPPTSVSRARDGMVPSSCRPPPALLRAGRRRTASGTLAGVRRWAGVTCSVCDALPSALARAARQRRTSGCSWRRSSWRTARPGRGWQSASAMLPPRAVGPLAGRRGL